MAKKKDEESEIMSSSSSEEEAEKKKKKHKKRETSSSEEESSEEEKKPKRGKNKGSSEESTSSSDRKSKKKKKNKRKTSSSDSSKSSESSSSNDSKMKGKNKPSTSRQFEDYKKLKEDLSAKFERIFQAKNNSFEATKKREMEELRQQKENFNKELVALQNERELISKLRLELEEQRLLSASQSSVNPESLKKETFHRKKEEITDTSSEDSVILIKKSKKNKYSSEESSSSSDEYATPDEEDAVEIINNFLPQEVNIVLLGDTGVGKSTFINSIANMLSHSTLEDAKMDLHVLIRTSFHHISDNHEQRQIVMEPTIQIERQGEADNESDKIGESCTKYPRSYVFKYGKKNERTLRIIDTPAVGDTRGVEQDRENFRHIINFISSFKEIHAFLFLMKPNDARLELQFRYCIKELLMHLHVSAINNIIFTFTNGRRTNYKSRMSETFGTLQALLNSVTEEKGVKIQLKDRCVVFDNESYRYLCECQYAIQHKDWEMEFNEESWTHGKKELSRMLKMISYFEPHDVNNTLSVNKVRRAIEIMARPLAELAKNLLINIQLIEEKEAEIEECLRIKRNLEDCLSIIFRGHMNYSPFFDGELADRAIQEVLASTNNRKKVAEDFLATKRTERDALERNLQRKQTICAHFAIFLKDNSVLAYNDQCLAYLNAFIRGEREKVNRGANGETLARLESCHEQYSELKKVFDNLLIGKKMTLREIENLIEEIKTMDYGDLIRDVCSLEIFYPAHKALDAPAIKIKQKIFKRVIKDGYNSAKKKIIKEAKKEIWDKTTKRTTRSKSKY